MSLLRRRSMLGLLGASALVRPSWAAPRTLVDSVGRNVVVPDRAMRILAAGPPASILIYAMAPDAMIGWVSQPGDDAKPFLLPQVRDLPGSGRLTMRGQEPDLESIAKLKPDLIVDFGSVGPIYVSLAEKIQKGAQVPYALIDGHLDKLPRTLRLAGNVMGRRDRGETLAAYAPAQRGGAIVPTFEQLTAWKPDVIVTFDKAAADAVRTDAGWKKITTGKRAC